uniref:Bm1625 n=1 Tax=Brugia malayi TaxID=6279 RepID=A0A1I9G3G1_BRUMA|nr:Bm1625 [Brugia malayi]
MPNLNNEMYICQVSIQVATNVKRKDICTTKTVLMCHSADLSSVHNHLRSRKSKRT